MDRDDKNDKKVDYHILLKVENEQNWKFPHLILGLSLGILAFSIQTTNFDKTLEAPLQPLAPIALFLSWVCFFLTFIFSFGRILHIQKDISKKYNEKAKELFNNDKSEVGNTDGCYTKIITDEPFGRFLFGAMMICLALGIILLAFHTIVQNWKFIEGIIY